MEVNLNFLKLFALVRQAIKLKSGVPESTIGQLTYNSISKCGKSIAIITRCMMNAKSAILLILNPKKNFKSKHQNFVYKNRVSNIPGKLLIW